jgi:glutathione S-transferase
MENFELHIHLLCPYAQRALYVTSFKNLSPQIIEQSLAIKSDSLYEINPLGKVPALKFSLNSKTFKLYESVQVCEFLDSFPGPSLYLRTGGPEDALTKSIINQSISAEVDEFVSTFVPFWWKNPTSDDKKRAQQVFGLINSRLRDGRFFLHEELGDVVTMADVMLYPFVERMWALRDSYLAEMFEGVDPFNTWEWFHRMSNFEWIKRFRAPERRLQKVIHLIKTKQYPGLDLPVSIYDQ